MGAYVVSFGWVITPPLRMVSVMVSEASDGFVCGNETPALSDSSLLCSQKHRRSGLSSTLLQSHEKLWAYSDIQADVCRLLPTLLARLRIADRKCGPGRLCFQIPNLTGVPILSANPERSATRVSFPGGFHPLLTFPSTL